MAQTDTENLKQFEPNENVEELEPEENLEEPEPNENLEELEPEENLEEPEEPEEPEPEEALEKLEELEENIEELELDETLQRLEPDANLLDLPSEPEAVNIDINEPISLEQAVELALRNNRELQEAQLNLQRSQQELQEARSELYPNLDLQADLTNSESASAERSAELSTGFDPEELDQRGLGNDVTSFSSDLTLSYDLYTGGRRGANIRRARNQVASDALDVERVTEVVLFETIRDYYALQNADAQVDIEQAAVEDANQTLRDAQLLEQAGLGTRFDVLRAEVELANANQRLTTAIADQKTARRQLVETLSLGLQATIQTADAIETAGDWEPTLEESIILGFQNRVELEQLLLRREINRQQKQIALSQIRPQLSVFATYDVLEQFDDDIDIADGYTVGARVQWTIFDGGAAVARARQSETDIQIDEVAFANQRNAVRLEVEQAFFDLQANEENIATSEKAVELAEESLRLARLRFQAGVGTQTDVIQAQTELTTARGNFLTAIINYNQSLNELQRAVDSLTETRLASETEN
ncbi:MAG TPA: TolC family protein [Xenococcaceae cyanobacterium]